MFPDTLIFFGMPIRLFGIFAAASILLGCLITAGEMKRLKISVDILPDLAFATLIAAFLGARLFFIFEHWHTYAAVPFSVFKFWEGGIVLYGGLLGGLLGGFLFCRRRKLSFAALSDPVALGLCFGLAFSRLGCLAAGCCYGKPTKLPWGIIFESSLAIARPLYVALHPTQIYSFLIGMAIFVFLMTQRQRKAFNGQILLTYFLLESGSRIFIEFVRADSYFITPLLAVVILGVSAIRLMQLKTKQKGESLMTKPIVKLMPLIFAVIFFAACGIIKTQQMTRGHDIQSAHIAQIKKGVSTEREMLHLFGPPTKARETEDGKEFFYEYAKSGGIQSNLLISVGGSTVTKTLLVWFDKNGVVTDYVFKSS